MLNVGCSRPGGNKMSDFLKKAKGLGSKAIETTQNAAETGKYKTQILSQKSKIKDFEKKIGKAAYEAYKEDPENIPVTEEIAGYCQGIDAAKDAIAVLEEKIKNVKA